MWKSEKQIKNSLETEIKELKRDQLTQERANKWWATLDMNDTFLINGHWIFAAIIANIFPVAAGAYGGTPIFLFFMVMMVCQLLFVKLMMPETKGVALEDMKI